ncbi:BTAD domain-containing putative transcriptional regulator [Actinosynnema sp. NPDC020468]|uniref:BTAD domain-containing putative transcriptional regulator n=1 Tax=Actinosynnema sp. NPDC020468 TaxID=3154488 RepID=UPI0034013561
MTATLDAAVEHKVVTVVGGPGWGKTTAAAAWAARRRACWLGIAEEEVRLERLTRSLFHALRVRLPGLPAELLTTTGHGEGHDGAARVEAVTTLVCGLLEVCLDEPLVLVVDEAGVLAPGSDGARLLEGLCRMSSPLLRLVLLTRTALTWELPEPVWEVNTAELAFTRDEVAALVGSHARPEVVDAIWTRTAGWPAAVVVHADAVRAGHVPPEDDGSAHRSLVGMARRVLADEPESTRRLLREIALLGKAKAGLCVALGHAGAPTLLPELARRGLLAADPGDVTAWVVPEPIRDLLADDDGSARELRLRAARFGERIGEHSEALRHLVTAGLWDEVALLLLRRDEQIIAAGDVGAVLSAMEQMPLTADSDPRLHLVWGYAKQQRGDWVGALRCYEQAVGEGPVLPCMAWRMGQLHHLTGRTDQALGLFRRAVFTDGGSLDEVRLLALAVRWLRESGEVAQAREVTARVIAAAACCGERTALAWSHRAQALLAAYDGDRVLAELHHGQALLEARRADNASLALAVRAERAWFTAEEGDPAEAAREVDEVLSLGRQAGITGHEPFCLGIRARAAAKLGRFDQALEDARRSQAMWKDQGVSRDVLDGLLVLGEVHRRRGEPYQAQAYLDEARTLSGADGGCPPVRVAVLAGLARIRAADDAEAARELADEAVECGTRLRWGEAGALLARGWVALVRGDREAARADAAAARALAGRRRDQASLADSLQLAALSAGDPATASGLLTEAVAVWRMAGDPVGEASALLAASRIGCGAAGGAEVVLARLGVRHDARTADVLGASRPRPSWLAVRTMGTFQVLRDGVPVATTEWQSKKARDLLKILVANRGRPVARSRLVELLWPDATSDRSSNRLSVLLSTLRAVLSGGRADAGPVVADRNAVALDLAVVDVDVERFLAAAEAARAAQRHGDPAGPALLAEAEELHHGEFLVEDLYEDWAVQPREEVRGVHASVLRSLVGLVSDVDQRVGYLLRLLDLDPYDEGAHLELVRSLREARRYGEARRRYDLYAERMAEIGVRPASADPEGDLQAG